MRFTGRIVLSSLLLLGVLAACDAPDNNSGIGTSPSGPTADDQPAQLDQVESPLAATDAGVDAAAAVAPAFLLRAPFDESVVRPAPQTAGFDLWQLLVDKGAAALKAALALLASAAAWLLVRAGLSAKWRSLIEELGAHAKDVVLYVFQTYVEAIKAGRADGKLTEEEKTRAKLMAIAALKERLGWKKLLELGGGLLARLFGGDAWERKVEGWLGGAVETAVAEAKRDGKASGLSTSGKDAPDSVVDRLPLKAPPEAPPLPR